MLRAKEARKLSLNELKKKESDVQKELMKLKGKASTGVAPENPGRIRELRKALARIKTIKKERGYA